MKTRPRTYLLTVWEGGGTLPPELEMARRLLDRGHAVHVLGDPTVEDDALAAGCGFSAWQRAPHRTSLDPAGDLLRDWEVSNPLAMLRRVRDVFVAGPAADYARDTSDAIDAVGPDVLVSDFMLFGALMAGEAAGLPTAAVIPNIWALPTPGAPAIGPGFAPARGPAGRARDRLMLRLANRVFAGGLPQLNAARSELGLPPLRSFHEQALKAARILVLTSPTFDFSSAAVPPNAVYVGPMLADPVWAGGPMPLADRAGEPLVLVAFSSTFQDQAPVLQRVVSALDGLPVRGVVTLGQMLAEGSVRGTARVQVVESAPHGPLLRRAAAVVTHCGHGTTLKALAAGVPLVCIPMGRDQHDTAARVVHAGAGVRIGAKASARRIARAVAEVLDDARYASRARELARAIAAERSSADVADELEQLAAGPAGAVGARRPGDGTPRRSGRHRT